MLHHEGRAAGADLHSARGRRDDAGEDTEQDFRDFMDKHGDFFPEQPENIDELLDAPEQITIDQNELARGQTFMGIGVYAVSDDGNLLAYSTDSTGFRQYLLRVRGDSMIKAGIMPDDVVVVRKQDTAADGEIVVALVGEEATVKRYFKEKDHIRLQPENDAHEPIKTRDAQILGRVVGLCRRVT